MRTVIVLSLTLLGACKAGYLYNVDPLLDTSDDPDDSGLDDSDDTEEDTGDDAPAWAGTGTDGLLEVSSALNLMVTGSNGRDQPDIVVGFPTGIAGDVLTVSTPLSGLDVGDEVVIINLQGDDEDIESVGVYAFSRIKALESSNITLEDSISEDLVLDTKKGPGLQKIVLQRVPNYLRVLIHDGGSLGASGWNGDSGGLLAMRVSDSLVVESGGAISLSGAGYRGGETGLDYGDDGFQGESIAGVGLGGGSSSGGYNANNGAANANNGGGGCFITGGGGEYGGGATPGEAWYESAQAPLGGEVYGIDNLSRLYLGSAGGGVWNGDGNPGAGGNGGGIIYIGANEVVLQGGEALTVSGSDGEHWSEGTYSYGVGGGAGGSVFLVGESVELATGSILALGGQGESAHERAGGNGGFGRVRVDCLLCNDFKPGSADAISALNDASEPDPGHLGAPL